MKCFGKVMWKAIDGREFIIDSEALGLNTKEKLMKYISDLRKKYGYEEPIYAQNQQFTNVIASDRVRDKFVEGGGVIDSNELSPELQEHIKEKSEEALSRPDPKTMN